MRSPEHGFRESPEPERWSGPEKVYFPDEKGKLGEWGISFLAKDFVKLVKVGEGGKLDYLEAPRADIERAATLSSILEFINKYGGGKDAGTAQDLFSGGAEKIKESVKKVIGSWPEFERKRSICIDSLILEMQIEQASEDIGKKEEQIEEIKKEIEKRGLWFTPEIGDGHAFKEISEKKEKILEEIWGLRKDGERLREAIGVLKTLEDIK